MTLMKLRLGFLFTDLSRHFRMYLVVFALKFFNSWSWVRRDVKSFICVMKLKSHATATQNFLNLGSLAKKNFCHA